MKVVLSLFALFLSVQSFAYDRVLRPEDLPLEEEWDGEIPVSIDTEFYLKHAEEMEPREDGTIVWWIAPVIVVGEVKKVSPKKVPVKVVIEDRYGI